MNNQILPVVLAVVLVFSGCQSKPVCTQGTDTQSSRYLKAEDLQAQPARAPSTSAEPVEVEINGKRIMVDKIVEGPLCNDTWQGTIYVGCNVQVLQWDEEPLFLKDCDLSIAEGTVVYVASHNNAAYFNGCSCHTGQDAGQK